MLVHQAQRHGSEPRSKVERPTNPVGRAEKHRIVVEEGNNATLSSSHTGVPPTRHPKITISRDHGHVGQVVEIEWAGAIRHDDHVVLISGLREK